MGIRRAPEPTPNVPAEPFRAEHVATAANDAEASYDVPVRKISFSVPTLGDMPSEDAFAVALGRRLGEGAGARDAAFADVEPLALRGPGGDIGHDFPLARSAHDEATKSKPCQTR